MRFIVFLIMWTNTLTSLDGRFSPSVSSDGETSICPKNAIPARTSLHGYIDYYSQNLTGYPLGLDMDRLMEVGMETMMNFEVQPPDRIKFLAINAEPFIFAQRDDNGFTVWGPLYSLLKEVILWQNYSYVEGIAIQEEDPNFSTMYYKPSFFIAPVYPHLLLISRMIDEKNMVYKLAATVNFKNGLTRAVGVIETDCIAFRKEFLPKKLFGFATFIDRYIVICVLFSIPVLAAIFGSKKQFLKKYFYHFLKTSETLFVFSEKFRPRFSLLFLLWITILWLFRQYFSSDMFSEMTRGHRPKVIDSWADLARETQLQIAGVKDFVGNATFPGEPGINEYFNPLMPHYDDFTARLTLVGVMDTQKSDILEVTKSNDSEVELVDLTTFDGDTVLMDNCKMLRYRVFNAYCGVSRDKVHVSQQGGDLVPYFVLHSWVARDEDIEVFDLFILRLTESGIYQKWLLTNTYNLKEAKERPPLAAYELAILEHFYGPLILFGAGLVISALFFVFVEYLFNFVKEKSQEMWDRRSFDGVALRRHSINSICSFQREHFLAQHRGSSIAWM